MIRNRRGVALLSVLAALVLLGTLAAGIALEALRLQRAARRAVAGHAAATAVESAIHERIGAWPVQAAWLARGAHWYDVPRASRVLDTPLAVQLSIVRLSATAYRIVATAVATSDDGRVVARRTAGQLVRLHAPSIAPTAAVFAFADPALADAALHGPTLSGRDTLVAGWECDPADSASTAGLALALPEGAAAPDGAIEGAPPVLVLAEDALRALVTGITAWLDDASDTGANGARGAALRVHDGSLHAPLIAPALNDAGDCDAAAAFNWGDPHRLTRCADARPLVWIRGSLIQPRGRSQGVLVVDGDLELGGGFTHHGIVIVRGAVGHMPVALAQNDIVLGALVLAQPPPAAHDMRSLRVRWSSCVVRTALRAIGDAVPAPGGWREGW